MLTRTLPLVTLLLLGALASSAASQQFLYRPGVLPEALEWSEGVVSIDVEADGDLDVVVTNGEGYLSAGTPLAPQLLINTGTVGGLPVFVDETATRFPAFVQHGRDVIAFDMEGDGDADLFFSNAFGEQQRLLRNDGSGIFADVTASHFTTAEMNSYGACAFDRDDDGDLDLAVCDHGGITQIGPGRVFRLFDNDGTGVFTDVSLSDLTGLAKAGQQNITPVDIDGDFDIDLVLDGKSTPIQLYVNDGTGNFTVDETTLPVASSDVYESDWADFDGDGDFDGFFLSYTLLSEGGAAATAENLLADGGGLSFVSSPDTLEAPNGFDDNEIVFLDFDNDGDLDPLVGSLAGNSDRIYRNDGQFMFSKTAQIQEISPDPTMDVQVGDFDGDGDYDFITVQGEFFPLGWQNRYFENVGTADSIGPGFLGVEEIAAPFGATTTLHVLVQDGIRDDGEVYCTVACAWTTDLTSGNIDALHQGGGLFRAAIPTAGASSLSVSWTATDSVGNVSSVDLPDGPWETVAAGTGGVSGVPALAGSGTLTPMTPVGLELTGAAPSSPAFILLGAAALNLPFKGGTLVPAFEPPLGLTIALGTSPAGEITLTGTWPGTIPTGVEVYVQVYIADAANPFGYASSNAVQGTVR